MYGVPWDEPRICRGCTRDPCTEDPIQCDSDAREYAEELKAEQQRDERNDRR